MLKSSTGEKLSAKGKAQELLAQALNREIDAPTEEGLDKATPREREELARHMDTIGNSLLKKLHQPLRDEE